MNQKLDYDFNNKALTDMFFGFNKVADEKIEALGCQEETGAIMQENGDVHFHIYAPNAKTVSVDIKILEEDPPINLIRDSRGFFDGLLEYDKAFTGIKDIDYIFDGTVFLHPYTPIHYCYERPTNYIEIPDLETDYILLKNVLHGSITKEIYYSKAIDEWEACSVYTPPEYYKGADYPVLYLQHGHTENELVWSYSGKINYIMDNLIAEGKCEPFIIVMNDGMVRKKGDVIEDYSSFEKMILEDCKPYIENKYHVKTDKFSRAMAGISMGSMQTSFIGFRHPELFGYIGLFSGFMSNLWKTDFDYSKEEYLSILRADSTNFENQYKVFFRSIGGSDDLKVPYFDPDDAFCNQYGIDKLKNYHRVVYKNQFHDWGASRRAVYDFAQLIFK